MKSLIDWFKALFGKSGEERQNQDKYENIFVAEILESEKHPNADRLRVVKVKVGDEVIFPVVCGAKNFKVGDKAVFAKPGAKIADGKSPGDFFTLAKAKIRGIESQGMLCAPDELGLGTDHSGIIILDANVSSGTQFGKYLDESKSK